MIIIVFIDVTQLIIAIIYLLLINKWNYFN